MALLMSWFPYSFATDPSGVAVRRSHSATTCCRSLSSVRLKTLLFAALPERTPGAVWGRAELERLPIAEVGRPGRWLVDDMGRICKDTWGFDESETDRCPAPSKAEFAVEKLPAWHHPMIQGAHHFPCSHRNSPSGNVSTGLTIIKMT